MKLWPFSRNNSACLICGVDLTNQLCCCSNCWRFDYFYVEKISQLPSEVSRRSLISFLSQWFDDSSRSEGADWISLILEWLMQNGSFLEVICTTKDWKVIAKMARDHDHSMLLFIAASFGRLGEERSYALARMSESQFRCCLEGLPSLSIENFVHSKHVGTLLEMIPAHIWTDSQLSKVILLASESLIEIPEKLNLRVQISESPSLKMQERFPSVPK